MNHTKPRKQCTPEFQVQVIELLAIGRPVAELAGELCISANLHYSWKSQLSPGGIRFDSRLARIQQKFDRAYGEGRCQPLVKQYYEETDRKNGFRTVELLFAGSFRSLALLSD